MSGAKEIRGKIRSVENTRKITRAMEMVAASKMRRAQQAMAATRPYVERMRSVISHLGRAHPEYRPPFLVPRPDIARVGIIVISTDRGLCGGLNVNLFRQLLLRYEEYNNNSIGVEFCAFGKKGIHFCRSLGGLEAKVENLGDKPSLETLLGAIKLMLDAYVEGRIDRLFLASNKFINTMSQSPQIVPLLPLPASDEKEVQHYWDYLYEPDPKTVLDSLLSRYIESIIYQAVLENIACEMASRMVAMKSATDNAGTLIDDLRLVYNKARQAAITQEISEIVGGVAAL